MAEAASTVPTFKLVLVGDGGTGKVRLIELIDALLLVLLGRKSNHHAACLPASAVHQVKSYS